MVKWQNRCVELTYKLLMTSNKSEVFLTGKNRLRGTFNPVIKLELYKIIKKKQLKNGSGTDGSFETFHGGTNGRFQLDNVGAVVERFGVDDHLQIEVLVLDNSLDGWEFHPQVVRVEKLERFHRFEIFHVLFWHLGDFQ